MAAFVKQELSRRDPSDAEIEAAVDAAVGAAFRDLPGDPWTRIRDALIAAPPADVRRMTRVLTEAARKA